MRRRWIQTKDGLKEVGVDYIPTPRPISHYIIGDTKPYRCAGLGTVVKSRQHRRELMKQKNLIEVGNELDAVMSNNDGRYDPVEHAEPSPELLHHVAQGLTDGNNEGEVITDSPVDTGEEQAPAGPAPDSLESIMDTMKATQERMVEDGTIKPDETIGGDPDEERHDLQSQEQGQEQQGSDILPEGQVGLLDKWNPVLQQATGQDEVSREVQEQLVDNLMSSWTGLQTQPVETALSIIDQYIPAEQRQQLITALAHKTGIDPLDIDVDSYAQAQPSQEFTALQQQMQNLQAQNMSLQVNQMKASGDYPLLSDASFSKDMAQVYGNYPDLSLEDAYRFVAAKNPNLSAQAAADVTDTQPTPPGD